MRIGLTLAVLLRAACGSPVVAEPYPSRPVTLVVPFTAGASNDIIGRYLANGLAKIWNQAVVVENKPGAGSAIGAAHVSQAKPNGLTLLFVSSTFTTNAAVQKDLPFDPLKDLQPVGIAATGPMVIVTGKRTSLPTLADLVREAKTKDLFYATTGVGSSTQFSMELFNDVAGIKMQAVHYKGGAGALLDLTGGSIDVYFGTVATLLPSIDGKSVTAVAVGSKSRYPALPNVPTVAEAGFAGAESDQWWGVFAPAGTPADVVKQINDNMRTVMTAPEAGEFLQKQGGISASMSVEQFSEHISTELARWTALAKKHKITVE